MTYRLKFKKSVLKDIRHFPQAVIKQLQTTTTILKENPHPPQSTKLKGLDNIYRYRFSTYRIVYQVDTQSNTITIIKIGHRKDIYSKL
jgi:mRNA interferase RelE/StbE